MPLPYPTGKGCDGICGMTDRSTEHERHSASYVAPTKLTALVSEWLHKVVVQE
jgi:hypothetical protein